MALCTGELEKSGRATEKMPIKWRHEIKAVPLQRPKTNVLLKSETGTRGRDGLPCPLFLVLRYYVNPIYD